MAEPISPHGAEVAQLGAELSGLVAELAVELDPDDGTRLMAVAERCDVILGLLRTLSAQSGETETPSIDSAGVDDA